MTIELELPDVLPRVESALHGPAHPDEFRVKVGRYGDRWYHDPLPACGLASACDDAWPSVTTIKKASDRDWTWVSLERAAAYLEQRRGELDGLNAAEIHARLLEVNKAGLGRAANRGTSIHHVMEALAAGGQQPDVPDEAQPYLPACQRFLDEAQPEWLLSEVVAISRTCGYGGTFDAVIRIDGGTFLVDWKTRKPGKHGAYPEEAWQLAAYARADYIVVDRGGVAVREPMPHLDGAYVISLAPEGYRPYPVDLDEAWQSFEVLRSFWDRKRCEHIGKPVRFATKPTPIRDLLPAAVAEIAKPTVTAGYRDFVVRQIDRLRGTPAADRLKAMWPKDIPSLKGGHVHTDDELRRVAALVEEAEKIPPEPTVDEGREMSREDVAAVLARFDALDAEKKAVLNGWATEAKDAGVSFTLRLVPSLRRFEIYRACLELAELADGDGNDLCRASIAAVIPTAAFPTVPIGHALGSLTIAQAEQLTAVAVAARQGEGALQYDLEGGVRWAFPETSITTTDTKGYDF